MIDAAATLACLHLDGILSNWFGRVEASGFSAPEFYHGSTLYGGEVYGQLAACVSKGRERQDRLIFPGGQHVIMHEICARMLFRTRDGHVSCLWSRTRVEMASSSRGVLLVQNELRDAHLHLVRRPPSCNLDALLY